MKDTAATRRYAAALFGAAQTKGVTIDGVLAELKAALALTQSNAELSGALRHALLPAEQKKAALSKASASAGGKKFSEITVNFLNLLIDKKRMDLLPLILGDFEVLVQDSKGMVRASVATPSALDEKSKKEMEERLSKVFGKKVMIENTVDASLLAGAVVKAGDTVIDNSLATQIKNMKLRFEHGY